MLLSQLRMADPMAPKTQMTVEQSTPTTAATGFNALTQEAKRKGYLTHQHFINLLPNDFADPSQMESIIDRLNEMGIRVYEFPPDESELLLVDEEDDEEEITEVIEAIATENRTTDPVRMYMREMGSVELLTREGEIEIAKRIENGIRQVMSALVYYPEIIESFIKRYHKIVSQEGRLSDIISGYFESDEEVAARIQLAEAAAKKLEAEALELIALKEEASRKKAERSAKSKNSGDEDSDDEKDKDKDEDEEGDSSDSEDAFDDNGPDPIYTAEKIAILENLY